MTFLTCHVSTTRFRCCGVALPSHWGISWPPWSQEVRQQPAKGRLHSAYCQQDHLLRAVLLCLWGFKRLWELWVQGKPLRSFCFSVAIIKLLTCRKTCRACSTNTNTCLFFSPTQTWPTCPWMTMTAPAEPQTKTPWPPCPSPGLPHGPWCTPSPTSPTPRMPSPASLLRTTSSPATATLPAALAVSTAKVSDTESDVTSSLDDYTLWFPNISPLLGVTKRQITF